jgi:hypothetical protein
MTRTTYDISTQLTLAAWRAAFARVMPYGAGTSNAWALAARSAC